MLESFARNWRDLETGFFGMTYGVDEAGATVWTRDLSLTFYAVRYLPHLVDDHATLIDTLLSLEGGTYPEGWLDPGGGMSDHNNYDVAELARRCWRFMRPGQRQRATTLINGMLAWCTRVLMVLRLRGSPALRVDHAARMMR